MPSVRHNKLLTPLTDQELDSVTIVFHQYETGLREGTIYTKDLLAAMKSLGLSPTEQEVVDMQCEVEKKGRIFFPDFCKLCLRKFREFDEENFRQIMFKSICGTEPHPVKFRAKKYKIQEKSFGLSDFRQMMTHLPEHVPESEISEMFQFADKNSDGRISYDEFLLMITPVRMPETPVILHRPQSRAEDDSVSVDTAKTPSEKRKKSPTPSGLSSGRDALVSLSQGSHVEDLEEEQELEEVDQEVEEEERARSEADVPVATLVSTA